MQRKTYQSFDHLILIVAVISQDISEIWAVSTSFLLNFVVDQRAVLETIQKESVCEVDGKQTNQINRWIFSNGPYSHYMHVFQSCLNNIKQKC